MTDIQKPEPWDINPNDTDPDFDWFWEDLLFLLPLWRGAGDPQVISTLRDDIVAKRVQGTTGSTWETGPVGPKYHMPNDRSRIEVSPNDLLEGEEHVTLTMYLTEDFNAFRAAPFSRFRFGSPSQILNKTDSGQWRSWWGNDTDNIGGDTGFFFTPYGELKIFTSVWDAGTTRTYGNGVTGNVYTKVSGGNGLKTGMTTPLDIGGAENTNSARAWNGDQLLVAVHLKAHKPEQIFQLHANPFGPLRQRDEATELAAIIASLRSAALSGTAEPSMTEAEAVAGGETIILTLTGDTFV